MKIIIQIFFILSIIVLINACSMNDHPVPPEKKILTGIGVMYGTAHIEPMQGGDLRDYNHSGILVEVVGTNISVFTTSEPKSKNGNFVISGLDSGIYTLRFSKLGYETQTISNINHNGRDSSIMKWVVSDSNGQVVYNGVALTESAPKLSIQSSTAFAKQTIRIDSIRDHEKDIIRRDTSYSAVIDLSLAAESPFEWSKNNYPIGFIAYIDKHSSPNSSTKPDTEYDNGDYYLKQYIVNSQLPGGIVKTDITPKSIQKIEYLSLKSYAKAFGVDLSKKERLYFHVYPFALQNRTRVYNSKYDPPYLGQKQVWVIQAPITIPIEWK